MYLQKKFFYLAFICFLFLFLAISYQKSDTTLKKLEKEVVATNTFGVYKDDVAIDFQLLNENGEKIRLSNYKGKKVMINFFATWCGPCQEEMPILVEIDKRTDKKKLEIIGVNVTKEEPNPNLVRKFVSHFQVKFEVLFDGEGKVMKDYQLIGIPTTLLIDESGKIVERINGVVTIDMFNNHAFFEGLKQ